MKDIIVISKTVLHNLATELWSSAQLLPNEGIEDGIKRIEDTLNEYTMET